MKEHVPTIAKPPPTWLEHLSEISQRAMALKRTGQMMHPQFQKLLDEWGATIPDGEFADWDPIMKSRPDDWPEDD